MWPVAGEHLAQVDERCLLSPWRDGWRCIIALDDRVRLLSRSGRDLSSQVPHLAEALRRHGPRDPRGGPTILDGLLVAPAGAEGEEAIASASNLDLIDVLCIAGRDRTGLDLPARQAELRNLAIAEENGLRVVPAWRGSAPDAYEQSRCAGAAGFAGLLARRIESPYRPGVRSPEWLAFTERPLEDFLLCGISAGGSLVLGVPTSHGLAFGGVTWPTRDWSRLAVRCREGAPAFGPPTIWPSLGAIAWARPELWVAATPDVRAGSGRGGPRWRFVRVQEDLSRPDGRRGDAAAADGATSPGALAGAGIEAPARRP